MENDSNKAHYDPGWNDPPKLDFIQQTSKPRNFLNKRVAFPLTSGVSSSSSPTAPSNLPPIPSIGTPPPVRLSKIDNSDQQIDSSSSLEDVYMIFMQILNDSEELGSKAQDIKKRISMMDEMWTNNKLNNSVKCLVRDLAYALRDNEPSKADQLHQKLMVEHVSSVGSWMPGVKQLIYYCIAKSELLSIDQDTST